MKITVIGAGGVGSRIIPNAHRMFNIEVMDGDVFETKNLDRQVVTRKYIGTNKAEAMLDMYEGVTGFIPNFLIDPDQLAHAEFVIAAPDNHMCRMLALEAADKYGFPLVLAGNEEYTANAMYYQNKYSGSSIDPRVRYPDIVDGAGREAGEACATRIVDKPQTGLANSMAADFALALAVYWLGELPSDALIKTHAPFEYLWTRSSVHSVRGYSRP
jgi:molybdopterin/thiamine biosynthesis adenylyltransferase